jgi:hypothetical protein
MARRRCHGRLARCSPGPDAGGFKTLRAGNKIRKKAAGAVYITLEKVFVRTTSGLFAVLDFSSFDRSLAFGI